MTAPSPEEVQAMQLVSAYGSDKGGLTGDGSHVEVHVICLAGGIAQALLAARAAGRREGIEASAKVSDNHAITCSSDLCCRPDAWPLDLHSHVIAREIRALLAPDAGEV